MKTEQMYHVAPREHRAAIESEGLQIRPDMTLQPGQEPGIYLWPTLDDAEQWRGESDDDIYRVSVPGNELWEDEAYSMGAGYTHKPIPPENIERLGQTVPKERG